MCDRCAHPRYRKSPNTTTRYGDVQYIRCLGLYTYVKVAQSKIKHILRDLNLGRPRKYCKTFPHS